MVNHNPVDGGYPTVQEMSDYLSPDQALEDTIQLITYIRNEIGCDPDKTHPNYCPIITVSFIRICVCVYVCVWYSFSIHSVNPLSPSLSLL